MKGVFFRLISHCLMGTRLNHLRCGLPPKSGTLISAARVELFVWTS
uniref:Uncharacterized protein n=1 Tax=Lotus japonicus TaxID=34305 RepID=I3SRP9_LOTJA|nr:unknown [Lotus japonicus]